MLCHGIHVTANLFGKDKLTFDGRIAFTESVLNEIHEAVERPLDGSMWWLQADEPWQFLAVCHELVNALKCKDPRTFVSNLPVHQDGSCNGILLMFFAVFFIFLSGLQHYAALGRDLRGAQQVDLIESAKPGDVYSAVADRVKELLAKDAESHSDPETQRLANALLRHVTRKVVKQTVMTSVYGVTFVGARKQIQYIL